MPHLFTEGISNLHNNPKSWYQQHYSTDRESEALRGKIRISLRNTITSWQAEMWTHLCTFRDWPLLPHYSNFVQGLAQGQKLISWIAEVGSGPPQPCWTLVFCSGKKQGWLCIAGPSIQWSLQSPLSLEHNPSTVIINTTPRLLPLKSFDLICEELPILDLMAPRHQGPSQLLLLCHQERNIFQGKQVSKSGFQMVMEWKFRALVRSTALSKCTWLKNTTIGTSVSTES